MLKTKKKRKTIGKMANDRLVWEINPVTKVVRSKKEYKRKEKHKKGYEE